MENNKNNIEYLDFLIQNVDFSVVEHEMIYDKENNPIDYKIIYVNKTFCDLMNLSEKDLVGRSIFEVFPKTEKYWFTKYQEVIESGKPLEVLRYSEQLDRNFSVYAFKSSGNSFVISFKDISDLLFKSELEKDMKPDKIVSSRITKSGFFEIDLESETVEVSDTVKEILGVEKFGINYFPVELKKQCHLSDYEKIESGAVKLLNGKHSEFSIELRIFNEIINDYKWISIFLHVTASNKLGKTLRFVGFINDIDEEKKKSFEDLEIKKLFKEARKIADSVTFIFDVSSNSFVPTREFDEFIGVKDLVHIDQFRAIVHEDDLEIYDNATDDILKNPKGKVTIYRIVKNNEEQYIQSSLFGTTNEFGDTTRVFGILKNITEIEITRRSLSDSRNSFELIFNSSPAGIFLFKNDFVIALENKTFTDFFKLGHFGMKLDVLLGDHYYNVVTKLKEGKSISKLRISHTIDGKVKHFNVLIEPIAESFQNNYQGTLTDITDEVLVREEIEYLASHDVLTGLYNRNYFENKMKNEKENLPLGILVCDVDGLKLLNDAFGHDEGDKLLIKLANLLENTSDENVVARIGGDEFVILVPNATEKKMVHLVKAIKHSLKGVVLFGIQFDVSIGYQITNEKNTNFDKTYITAENYMYRKKLKQRTARREYSQEAILRSLYKITNEDKAHCDRVGKYSSLLLNEIGFKRNKDLEEIIYLGKLHDIGIITISEEIRNKRSQFTEEERVEHRLHSESGYRIVKNLTDIENVSDGVLYHHENYDGTGYPHGLKGEEIPIYARIIRITHYYDMLLSTYLDRKVLTKSEALDRLIEKKGTYFDGELVDKFVNLMRI